MFSPNEFSTRKLSQYYAVALLLIGFLALASHLVQRSAAGNIEGMAGIINVRGRQRMISQRIASLVAQYQLGDASARAALKSSIADFETAHQRLSRGDLADNSSPNDPHLIQHLYFDGPHPVDADRFRQINDTYGHPAGDPRSSPSARLSRATRAFRHHWPRRRRGVRHPSPGNPGLRGRCAGRPSTPRSRTLAHTARRPVHHSHHKHRRCRGTR